MYVISTVNSNPAETSLQKYYSIGLQNLDPKHSAVDILNHKSTEIAIRNQFKFCTGIQHAKSV